MRNRSRIPVSYVLVTLLVMLGGCSDIDPDTDEVGSLFSPLAPVLKTVPEGEAITGTMGNGQAFGHLPGHFQAGD